MGTILITGASRGIGAHLAQRLAASGHTVYAGMRRPGNAPVAAPEPTGSQPGEIRPVALDVTAPESVAAAVARIDAETDGVDLLVNNAGVAWFAPAEEMSERVLRETLETNFFGAVSCAQAVLPRMRERGQGCIVTVSSIAAAFGLPLESAYCASKSAVEAFSESLRHEVARFGIRVAVVEPGITAGGLSTSIADPQAPAASPYEPLITHTFAFYDAAQSELESPDLIVDAIRSIWDDPDPPFRHRLGRYAAMIEALERAGEAEASAGLRDALGIGWWCGGARESAA